jgi:hypothetical protein
MSKTIFSIKYLTQTLSKKNVLQEKNKPKFSVEIEIPSGNNQSIITEKRKEGKTSIVTLKEGIKVIGIIKIEDIIKGIVIINKGIMEVIDIVDMGIIEKMIEGINIIIKIKETKEIKEIEMKNMISLIKTKKEVMKRKNNMIVDQNKIIIIKKVTTQRTELLDQLHLNQDQAGAKKSIQN